MGGAGGGELECYWGIGGEAVSCGGVVEDRGGGS